MAGERKKKATPATRAKWARCLQLRQAGAAYRDIAQTVGYSGPGAAYNAVQSALDEVIEEPAREVLVMEMERLDRMQLGLWQNAVAGDGPSVDRVLRIMERRARYLGLDAEPEGDDGQLLDLVEALAELRRATA